MKKDRRIPTILGIFLLLIGIFGGVVLIKKPPVWFSRAEAEIIPKEVKITNIADNSFSVSWITDRAVACFVQYGSEKDLSFVAKDDRDELSGQQGNFLTHHVTLRGLRPVTNYFFKINCGDKLFDNNGQPYQVKTGPSIQAPIPANDIAYGTIFKQDNSPAEGVIVYLSLANSFPLSTLTRASGSWVIPLNFARTTDLSSWAVYDKEASIEEIFVQGGVERTAAAIAATKYDSPLPAITLGQNFDFRQVTVQTTPTPTPTLISSASSGFSVPETEYSSSSANLMIINPSEGENINNSMPEILGTGPAGETLTIVVNSPESFTSQVNINVDGTWSWTPPSNLSPGEHTITVSLADGRRESRAFTVLATGSSDLPSFTASPSATIVPTLTPTAIPTISRSSIPSTEEGVPTPGNLTPTFLFSIVGLGLIFLGLIWKKVLI